MWKNNDAKALIAVSTLTAAVFIGLNWFIAREALNSDVYVIGAVLLFISFVFWVLLWLDVRASRRRTDTIDADIPDKLALPQMREWTASGQLASGEPVEQR